MSKFTSAMNAAVSAAKDRSTAVSLHASQAAAPEPPAAAPVAGRRGRPAGKRSSASTVQVTAYIQTETHYATKLALLMNSRKGGPRQDFSDLVESLLVTWLNSQQA